MNNQNKPNNRNKAINKLIKEVRLADLFLYLFLIRYNFVI